ncbi:hypothetical protein L7F22_002840 [Adiantum nelumboides]|nr:hypothetical protein [Adiantum nelumboides]
MSLDGLHHSAHRLIICTQSLPSSPSSLLQSRWPLYTSSSRFSDLGHRCASSIMHGNWHTNYSSELFDDGGLRKVHFLTLLSSLSSPQYLLKGLLLHCCIMQIATEDNVIFATALVKMYNNCGSLEDARGVFDMTSNRDVVLWTALITAYSKRGFVKDAVELFDSMVNTKVTPDAISFANILDACRSFDTIDINSLCGQVETAGLDTNFDVGRALLNLHAARGNLTEARKLFHKLPKHNRITWNIMIALYSRLHLSGKALQLYNDMQQEDLIPDVITFVAILQAFCCKASLAQVRHVHVHILAAQLVSNTILLTTLMNIYGRCKSAEDMFGVWECIASKNVVVWGAFIGVLTELSLGQQALDYSSRMLVEGVLPNEVTYTSSLKACTLEKMLIKGKQLHACLEGTEAFANASLVTALLILYSNCSTLDEVRRLFDVPKHRDAIFWTAAMSAHTFYNHGGKVVQLLYQMLEEGVLPNLVTYTVVLEACSTLLLLSFIKQVHARIDSKDVTSNMDLGTALVNMYGKCGCLANAREVFNAMLFKDRLSWTAIVSAYAHNGKEEEALETFELMVQQGVLPDGVAFLSIMSSCIHSGLSDLGIVLFIRMKNEFGLKPLASHYDCVADLLGRAGQLNVAEQLVNHMPTIPSEISWNNVLAACKYKTDIYRGNRIAQLMCGVNRQNTTPMLHTLKYISCSCKF